jgi:hypothetical protein
MVPSIGLAMHTSIDIVSDFSPRTPRRDQFTPIFMERINSLRLSMQTKEGFNTAPDVTVI